jgi:flagellar capping protein FliD
MGKTSNDDLINYLTSSVEALRIENTRLLDENERLINNIEVIDAELVTHQNGLGGYYNFMNNFNYQLKSTQND